MRNVDGHTRIPFYSDIIPGNVLRMVNSDESASTFSDCLIVGYKNDEVMLERPYAKIINGKSKFSSENFTVNFKKLISDDTQFRIVLKANNEPLNHSY